MNWQANPLMPSSPPHTCGHRVVTQRAVLTFDLLPTSYLFKRGHSIRLAVAGADADHFAPLPGDLP